MMRLAFAFLLTCNIYASEVIVAAASDLSRLAPKLAEAYKLVTGNTVRFTLGSSGLLHRQIENGAPYDVYLAANEQFVEAGVRHGVLRKGTERVYATGRLAVWSRSGKFRTLEDLARPAVLHIAIANPAHAPYGVAAQEALEKKGLWAGLTGRLVFGENIRQALQYAESGNAEAAVVAWSLVFDRGGVLVPETLHNPIRQAGAMVNSTRQPENAARFLEFLSSAAAREILTSNGFSPQDGTPGR